jgi:ATP-dependent helicase HrpA
MESSAVTTSLAELQNRLPGLMLRDQRRLGRRAEQAAALADSGARQQALDRVLAEVETATAQAQARRASVPVLRYPPELPVSQRKDEIAAAIRDHQVVIVAGETGSGKTTQLPKICLELGRGVAGQIGHTQPRRIAARTVAERIASELDTELGTTVGYKVRFTDTSSDSTLIKVMTDGILLTELQRDRQLLRYDTLIIDEAHERSLNIDFILGYLKQLLPRRPDLKVIITSATIDPQRFSDHFGGAPIVEVSGRTYPVEVRYRPLADPDDPDQEPKDQVQGILDALTELSAESPGDVLVFLSGEREIRDTADALDGTDGLEVLPLYARLSSAEQHRVFDRKPGAASHFSRRVVLATNVAETSLTVPGIRYVIDPGTARISRYSQRTKVQRLPIEPISQASANQRKGRCGRTSDGICIRLYTEADFESRPEFTDPEILRTNLASVILQMAALDLGDMADFPFVEPPESRNVADGVRLLEELGAFSPGHAPGRGRTRLTETGRKLSRLPLDPRLGRMILEAGHHGCVREVLIITAALSIIDPRERPTDARQAADEMHARFAEPGSDFLAFLNLWDYLRERQSQLSTSAFRRLCRREYLHFLRVREWQDVYGQLRQAAADLGIQAGRERRGRGRGAEGGGEQGGGAAPAGEQAAAAAQAGGPAKRQAGRGRRPGRRDGRPGAAPAPREAEAGSHFPAELADRVHMSLLSGLLSHIGMQDTDARPRGKRRPLTEFAGARGARFAIFPDSSLARKPPQWVVAAELVETSRLWARVAARIEPEWAESLAAHLVRRSYSEPRWDARRGAAVATEKVSLYGLPIVAARTVMFGRIDPAAARDLFITHALVEGDWQTHHKFFARNQQTLADAEDLERKARRRGLIADDSALFAFYDQRIPAEVISARHFDTWWKQARAADPALLDLSPADLITASAEQISPDNYPAEWADLPVSYEFAPGEPDDGVSVDIPLARLNQVSAEEFSWQVPGLRQEMVTELIRSLPKQLRTTFVPVPDTARTVLPRLGPARGDLLDALGTELSRLGGVHIPRSAWDMSRLPAYLRITFRVVEDGRVLAEGKDLDELRRQLRPRLQATLSQAATGITRTGLRTWDVGTLPRVFSHGQVRAYPALADTGDAVDVRLFETRAQADAAMLRGTRRLLLLQVASGARAVASRLPVSAKLAMSRHPYPSTDALLDDCAAAAADQLITEAGGPAWDEAGFARLLEAARSGLAARTADVVALVARALGEAHQVEASLATTPSPPVRAAFTDLRAQLARLVHPGFVTETGARRLPDLVRYLRGMSRRLEKMPEALGRDAERMAVVQQVSEDYQQTLADLPPARREDPDVRDIRWMIEELRVSLFAQTLGTSGPVSERRIEKALEQLHG